MPHYQTSQTEARAQLTIAGRERAIKEGRTVGVCPLGYKLIFGQPGGKSAVLDEAKAPFLCMGFCLVAEGASIRTAAEHLGSLGLLGHHGEPISIPTLHVVLRNPFYIGLLRYKGDLYQGNHQPLISRTLFNKVQEGLERRRYRSTK